MCGLAIGLVKQSSDSFSFGYASPSSNLSISVILPAKNEAYHIEAALDALRLQRSDKGKVLQSGIYEVLVLANNCTDNTFETVRCYQQRHPGFALHVAEIELGLKDAHIGKVRKMLMDEASRRFDLINNHAGIIASTDSDTVVDAQWLFNILLEIKKGVDAVGGRILTLESAHQFMTYQKENEIYRTLRARAESIIDPLDHDPWPRHFQYFGANMAVKKSMYQAVGGIPELRYLEDNALHDALCRMDARIRMSPKVTVTTSIRTEGRVEIGFSEQLRKWSDMHENNILQEVASGEEIVTLLRLKRRLRNCWAGNREGGLFSQTEAVQISEHLMVDRIWLIDEIKKAPYFGMLWLNVEAERVKGNWMNIYPPVAVDGAIAFLERFVQ